MDEQLVTMVQALIMAGTQGKACSPHAANSTFLRRRSEEAGTSLLHLAAGLGLVRLTGLLLHAAVERPASRLSLEADPLARDSQGYTPLVREHFPSRIFSILARCISLCHTFNNDISFEAQSFYL